MKIEEIDNQRLHFVQHHIVVELVLGLHHANMQVVEVVHALFKLRGSEVHNGIK